MKGFDMLPRAEKIPIDRLFDNMPIKDDKKSGVYTVVLFIFFMVTMVVIFTNKYLGPLMFAALYTFMLFNRSATIEAGGKKLKNTLWNRSVFIFGAAFIWCGFYSFYVKDNDYETFRKLARMIATAIIITVIIRLIYLILRDMAIYKREKECTEGVFAEPARYVLSDESENGEKKIAEGDLLYRYYYNEKNYRFVIPEDSPSIIYENSYFIIGIDPEQPERYFSEQLFYGELMLSNGAKNLRTNISVAAFLLLMAFVFFNA